MINITPVTSASNAAEYFASDSYYSASEAQEASAWVGLGAEALGLTGQVETQTFSEALSGKLPDGSEIKAQRGELRAGLDLTVTTSASVSILALATGDQRIVEAFKASVASTLAWTEKNLIEARVWNAAEHRQIPEKTGNLVAAAFLHNSNRSNEPMLHTHVVLAAATLASDGKWHAMQNDQLFQNQRLMTAIHNSDLRNRIEELGYETVPAKNAELGAFEIKGVSREVIETFTTRRAEILEALKAGDRGSARERELAALSTRKPKAAELTNEEKKASLAATAERIGFNGRALVDAAISRQASGQTIWSQLAQGFRTIGAKGMAIAAAMGLAPKDRDPLVSERLDYLDPEAFAAAQSIASAARELGENEAAFDRHDLMRIALSRGGPIQVADVEARIDHLIQKNLLIGNDRMVTTQGAIALEQRAIDLAKAGIGKVEPLLKGEGISTRLQQVASELGMRRLNAGQEAAGVRILQSPNRVELVQGGAGTGKSAALIPVSHIAQTHGHNVIALAHAGKVAREFGAKIDAPASTVQSFLARHRRIIDGTASPDQMLKAQTELRGSVIMVDESSLIGTERLGNLINLANRMDSAKIIFAGDTSQLQAIEAGKPFALLQKEGLSTSHIIENLRATSPQMKALNTALDERDIQRAFEILKPDTIEVPYSDGPKTAAKAWVRLSPEERQNTLLLASGRAMRAAANLAVQTERKERYELGFAKLTLTVHDRVNIGREGARQMTGYKPDRIVEFRSDLTRQGFKRGDLGRVLDSDGRKVDLLMPDGEIRKFEPGRLPYNLSNDAVSIFQEKQIDLHKNDQIRWTDTDKPRGLLNGDIGQITALDSKGVTITMRDGETQELKHDDPMLKRIDLAYAINVHIAQSLTCENGIILMTEREKALNTTQSFLVAVTRIADSASLIVDNVKSLEWQVLRNPGEKTSALELKRDEPSASGPSPAKEKVYDMDFGM